MLTVPARALKLEMSLISSYMGDLLVTADTLTKLRPVYQTKESLLNKNSSLWLTSNQTTIETLSQARPPKLNSNKPAQNQVTTYQQQVC